jgi:hypothetical protein
VAASRPILFEGPQPKRPGYVGRVTQQGKAKKVMTVMIPFKKDKNL